MVGVESICCGLGCMRNIWAALVAGLLQWGSVLGCHVNARGVFGMTP